MLTNCSHCTKEINRKPADIKRFKNSFCSKDCRKAFKTTSITFQCAECGVGVSRTPSEVKKNGSHTFFCTKSCFATFNNKGRQRNWKGGKHSYRQLALRELERCCNRCGYHKYEQVLQVHHKDCDRNNNDISNLEVLCPTCHVEEHLVSENTK